MAHLCIYCGMRDVKVGGSLVSRLVSVDRVYSTEVHEV